MEEKFIELLDYNQAMNLQTIKLIETYYPHISDKTFQLFSHTLNAHQIWNARINGQAEFDVWQLNNFEELSNINKTNHSNTQEILATQQLDRIVQYRNSKGNHFSNKLEDIIFHIINHSTYHRAQIATEFRNSGLDPLISDYIFHKRL